MIILDKIYSYKNGEEGFVAKCDKGFFKVRFYSGNIVRITADFGEEEKHSYSLLETIKVANGIEDSKDEVAENATIRLSGSKLTVLIKTSPLQVTILDNEGNVLHNDIVGRAYCIDSNLRRIHTSQMYDGDHFYGFGENAGELNKFKHRVYLNPKDAMGYDAKRQSALYKHIPFYIRLNEKTKKAVGYFYHNSFPTVFDLDSTHSNYWPKAVTYTSDGGMIDYFFIAGPKVSTVIEGYASLTGTSALLPKYALGYLGSSMYYSEQEKNCDAKILDFVKTAKKEYIPIDGFQLSSGYLGKNRFMFEWDKTRFPNPKRFFDEMTALGITVSPNVKPGMLSTHPMLEHFNKKGLLVKKDETEEAQTALWWGGEGYYLDFTNPLTREVWKQLLKEYYINFGVDSFWNDNCEFDGIFDDDARISFENKGACIKEGRVVMSNLMCETAKEALLENNPDKRPFVVCRSGHSGIQRFAQVWAGDNETGFETLKYNIATMLGMSVSGVSNVGCDVGGFWGPAPSKELLVRWVQMGIFEPRFSIHSANTDNTVTEPWMYPSVTGIIRDAIFLRYRLFPYFYSLMREANRKGIGILRPLFMECQEDVSGYDIFDEFFVGKALLVAPVVEAEATGRMVYFPEGETFYDFYSGERIQGGKTQTVDAGIEVIPLYIRGGEVLVMAENQIMNLHEENVKELKIVAGRSDKKRGQDETFTCYEDDGLSNAYLSGYFCERNIKLSDGEDFVISSSIRGKYKSELERLSIEILGFDQAPLFVSHSKEEYFERFLYEADFEESTEGWYHDTERKSVKIKSERLLKNFEITVSNKRQDLIGM